MYFCCKHEPNYNVSYSEASEIISKTESAINNINILNIGTSNDVPTSSIKRVFGLAAGDILHTGETVINIMIPKEEERKSDFIPFYLLEFFNINWEGWVPFKEKFESEGTLHLGKQFLPDKVYKFLSSEGDFIDAGVYDGDYRNLVLFLSSYIDLSLESKFFFEDQRASNVSAMFSSVLMAGVDVIRQIGGPIELDLL